MVEWPHESVFCLEANALLYLADLLPADKFPYIWEALSEMAAAGTAAAPDEALAELAARDDNGACTWAWANKSLFRTLDDAQMEIAREVAELGRSTGLLDTSLSVPSSVPFTAALAISMHVPGAEPMDWPILVNWNAPGKDFEEDLMLKVCRVYQDKINPMGPVGMLMSVGLKLPPPREIGHSGLLYGMLRGVYIPDEALEASKLQFRGYCR